MIQSDAICAELARNPWATQGEIVAALAARGIKVSKENVKTVMARIRAARPVTLGETWEMLTVAENQLDCLWGDSDIDEVPEPLRSVLIGSGLASALNEQGTFDVPMIGDGMDEMMGQAQQAIQQYGRDHRTNEGMFR